LTEDDLSHQELSFLRAASKESEPFRTLLAVRVANTLKADTILALEFRALCTRHAAILHLSAKEIACLKALSSSFLEGDNLTTDFTHILGVIAANGGWNMIYQPRRR
jgi:hypothetical protein